MAANGGCEIDYSYPALDSWRKERSKYVHNTSGATKKRVGRHDRVEGLDPAGATLGAAGLSVGAGDYYDEEDGAKASGSGGIAIQDDSDGEDGGDDPAYFSQAGIALGDDDEEASGTFRQRYDNDEDDGADEAGDIETIAPAPKRVTVTVKKRLITRGLYYIDARGREVDTDRSDWRRMSNGYELQGRKHTYFTKSFPG
ncbi:hypothetical protein GE09DRAFT_1066698 [Coniochaeta sp. 2T2.1]|nr:hypothetical protein GE09DRAFT_1066698 [Coniochaeta sp. 2T2.1]